MKIYHNPRCSKSRETLALIESEGVKADVIEYLKTPPTLAELKDILKKLKMRPKDILRIKDEGFEDLDLDLDDDQAVLKALHEHPRFMERPIVVTASSAVIGRPPANVRSLF